MYDLVVVGLGIYGLCVADAAASKGLGSWSGLSRHQTPSSFNTPRWFFVKKGSNGVSTYGKYEGFVKAERVSNQWTSSPPCSSNDRVSALLWATKHMGVTTVSTTDQNAYRDLYPGAGLPFADGNRWSGDCIGFAALAWWNNGHGIRLPLGDAIEVHDIYVDRRGGPLTKKSPPPAGALVFWDVSSWGHVGISIGNGRVIATRGLDSASYAINDYPVSYWSNYLGWTVPS